MRIYIFLALFAVALGKEEKCFAPMICNKVPTWARISRSGEDGTCGNQIKHLEEKANHLDRSIDEIMFERLEYLKNLKSTTTPVTVDNIKETTAQSVDSDAKMTTPVDDTTTSEPVTTRKIETTSEASTPGLTTSDAITTDAVLVTTTSKTSHGIEAIDEKSTAGLIPTTADAVFGATTSETTQGIETTDGKFTAGLTTSVATTTDADSVWYDGKRFVALASSSSDLVIKAEAISKCHNISGELANVYSLAHMEKIIDYIRRNKLDGSRGKYFHLGMTYDPINEILRLRNGTQVSIGDYKWWSFYPRNGARWASSTNMYIRIDSDPSFVNQYLLNYPDHNFNVLCEI